MPKTIPEFAAAIKSKYPQYKDMNDTLLVQKITEKYPQYKSEVEPIPKQVSQPQPSAIPEGAMYHDSGEDWMMKNGQWVNTKAGGFSKVGDVADAKTAKTFSDAFSKHKSPVLADGRPNFQPIKQRFLGVKETSHGREVERVYESDYDFNPLQVKVDHPKLTHTYHDGYKWTNLQAVKVGAVHTPDIKEAIDNVVKDKMQANGLKDKDSEGFYTDFFTNEYKKGKLIPTLDKDGKSVMKEGTGVFSSFINAVNDAAIERMHNANLVGLDTEGKIKYLKFKEGYDKEYKSNTVPGRSVFGFDMGDFGKGLNEASQFGGENADMLAKGGVGAMSGGVLAPELVGAAHFGSFLTMVDDFASGGYGNSLQKTFGEVKQQNPQMSDHDAMKKAESAAVVGAATGIAAGAVLSGTPKLKADNGVVEEFFSGLLKSSAKMGAVSGAEAGVNDVAEMGVGVHKTAKEIIGHIGESSANGIAVGAAFHVLLNPLQATKALLGKAKEVVASIPKEQVDEILMKGVKEKTLTPEKADEINSLVSVVRPNEMNKPEVTTIAPQENAPAEESKGAAVILPKSNREPNIIELKKAEPDPINEDTPTQAEIKPTEEVAPKIEAENLGGNREGATATEEAVDIPQESVNPAEITHAAMDKMSERLGLPERYEKDPTTRAAQDAEAIKRVNNGEMPALIEKLQRKEMPSAVEQRMMAYHVAELDAKFEKSKSDADLAEYRKVRDLSNIVGGHDVAQSLQARQGVEHPLDEGLTAAMAKKADSNGVDKLTDAQKAQVEELVSKYKNTAETEKAARLEIEQKYNEFLAKKEVAEAKSEAKKSVSSAKKTKDDFVKERKDIVQSIKEKWSKAANDNTLTAVPVPYAKQLAAIAPDVAKLVRNLVEDGVSELSEIIKNIHGTIKEVVPEITEKDIQDIIAGEYRQYKETKNELSAKVFELQREAELLSQLAKLEADEIPTSENKKKSRNQKIAAIRKKINAERKRLGLNELTTEQKIQKVIDANERTATKYKERIANGDFETKKRVPFSENYEFQRQHEALYNKAINSIRAKNDAKAAFDIAMFKDEMAKANAAVKVYRFLGKAKNTFQSIVAGVDDSLMFVQLGYTLLRNPDAAVNFRKITHADGKVEFVLGGGIKEHILDAWSKERFDKKLAELHTSPFWKLIEASGLDVLEPKSLTEQQKEEMFQHNLAQYVGLGVVPMGKALSLEGKFIEIAGKKVPLSELKRANLGKFLAIWERAYTSLGNHTRVYLFTKQAKFLYEKGITIENNPEEFKGLARAINNLTGRGSMHPKVAQVMPWVTPVIWSPKMMASTINLLGLTEITGKGAGFYTKLPPKARAYAAKQMAGGFAIAGGVMLAAAIGGATVHWSPHDPRWGEIEYGKDGSLSFNVFGRYAWLMRMVAQLLPKFFGGGRMDKDGVVRSVYDEGGEKAGKLVGTSLRGKMNPVSGLMYDYVANDKTGFYDNKPITLTTAKNQLVIPMALRNVRTEMERDGTISLLNYSLPNFVGISMKDERDYYVSRLGDTPQGKFLQDKKIKLPETTKTNQTRPKDEKHPDGKMDDDDFDKFKAEKDVIISKGIAKLMKNGWQVGLKVKSANKLSQTELEDAVTTISDNASKEAKEKLFGKSKANPVEEKLKSVDAKMNKMMLKE